MTDQISHSVLVHGRVQGVLFRDSLRGHAEQHGVAGWVKNNADGTVEAVLEGPEGAVEAVLEFIRTGGPPYARVHQVEVHEQSPAGLSGFEVR